MILPPVLAAPRMVDGKVAAKILLDLTVYLEGPSLDELEALLDLYERLCPKDRLEKFTIAELDDWWPIATPYLTDSGRAARAAGIPRPYFEPARKRIREGRAFRLGYWDGRLIEDPVGSFSFTCGSIKLRDQGLFAFARILAPVESDPEILHRAAVEIADRVELLSGHGGLAFVYDPWLKEAAFDDIYLLARRYWGIDVEDLNETLPLTRLGIKGVSWLTLLGASFAKAPKLAVALPALAAVPGIAVDSRARAVVLVAGPQPVVGDQNHPDASLDPAIAIARVLKPIYLTQHPDFSSARFIRNKNTVGWLRRFVDPSGWR